MHLINCRYYLRWVKKKKKSIELRMSDGDSWKPFQKSEIDKIAGDKSINRISIGFSSV